MGGTFGGILPDSELPLFVYEEKLQSRVPTSALSNAITLATHNKMRGNLLV